MIQINGVTRKGPQMKKKTTIIHKRCILAARISRTHFIFLANAIRGLYSLKFLCVTYISRFRTQFYAAVVIFVNSLGI